MDNDSYIEMLEEALDEVDEEIKAAFLYGFFKGALRKTWHPLRRHKLDARALNAYEKWKEAHD